MLCCNAHLKGEILPILRGQPSNLFLKFDSAESHCCVLAQSGIKSEKMQFMQAALFASTFFEIIFKASTWPPKAFKVIVILFITLFFNF